MYLKFTVGKTKYDLEVDVDYSIIFNTISRLGDKLYKFGRPTTANTQLLLNMLKQSRDVLIRFYKEVRSVKPDHDRLIISMLDFINEDLEQLFYATGHTFKFETEAFNRDTSISPELKSQA